MNPTERMASDDEPFLTAIHDQPEDDNCRLVYADWLEERGDPRAEYLRVEYEARVSGAKQEERLAILRSQLDPDWLRAVHDGKLGPDWAVVLQDCEASRHAPLLELICETGGLSETEAEGVIHLRPAEIKKGLRYWDAHRLRQSFGALGHFTVEYRPTID